MKLLKLSDLVHFWGNVRKHIPTKTSDLTNDSNFAVDSNVVHVTGNETIAGTKTFTNSPYIYNSDSTANEPNIFFRNSKYAVGDTNTGEQKLAFTDKNNSFVGYISSSKNNVGTQYLSFKICTTDNNDSTISSTINYTITKAGAVTFAPYENGAISLGNNVRRWAKIHANNYYYGSDNVEFSTKFMTTDTNQTVSGVKTFSDDTYIKSLNFTNEVPSPSSSSSAIMPIVTTITYGDSSPSQSARLNLRITADGIKSFYPHENNAYSLGLNSRSFSDFYTYHGYFRGQQQNDEFSINARTNLTLLANRDTLGSSGCLIDTFRENTTQGTGMHFLGFGMKENSVRYEGCRFSWLYDDDNNGYVFTLRPTTQGTNQPIKYELGNSLSKWTTINGLNPSSLGMPDLNNGIDISSYFTLGTSSNTYTPSANGWICIKGVSSASSGIYVESTNGFYCSATHMIDINSADHFVNLGFPVIKNEQYTIVLKTVNTSISAKFYPCQGNV